VGRNLTTGALATYNARFNVKSNAILMVDGTSPPAAGLSESQKMRNNMDRPGGGMFGKIAQLTNKMRIPVSPISGQVRSTLGIDVSPVALEY